MLKRREPGEVSREVLALLDDIEELLSERVLMYAVRGWSQQGGTEGFFAWLECSAANTHRVDRRSGTAPIPGEVALM
mgnify:CR=1 FL=1